MCRAPTLLTPWSEAGFILQHWVCPRLPGSEDPCPASVPSSAMTSFQENRRTPRRRWSLAEAAGSPRSLLAAWDVPHMALGTLWGLLGGADGPFFPFLSCSSLPLVLLICVFLLSCAEQPCVKQNFLMSPHPRSHSPCGSGGPGHPGHCPLCPQHGNCCTAHTASSHSLLSECYGKILGKPQIP